MDVPFHFASGYVMEAAVICPVPTPSPLVRTARFGSPATHTAVGGGAVVGFADSVGVRPPPRIVQLQARLLSTSYLRPGSPRANHPARLSTTCVTSGTSRPIISDNAILDQRATIRHCSATICHRFANLRHPPRHYKPLVAPLSVRQTPDFPENQVTWGAEAGGAVAALSRSGAGYVSGD